MQVTHKCWRQTIIEDTKQIQDGQKQSVYQLFRDKPNTTSSIAQPTENKLQKNMQKITYLISKTQQLHAASQSFQIDHKNDQTEQNLQRSSAKPEKKQNFQRTLTNLTGRYMTSGKIRLRNMKNKNMDIDNNQKISRMCRNLITKLKRNNVFSPPISEQELQVFQEPQEIGGFVLNDSVIVGWNCLGTFALFLVFIIHTFALVFQEVRHSAIFFGVVMLGIFYFTVQIILQMMTTKRVNGRKVNSMKQNFLIYLRKQFILDSSINLCLLLIIFDNQNTFIYFVISLFIFKTNSFNEKFRAIEIFIMQNFHYEKYWSLFKIILFNFAFAHVVAILLNIMAQNNPHQNWQMVKSIENASWSEKYIWSYYWATTIMLTVGFGDITPSCSQEALWVIFIEIASCIAFSYNISCLGKIISEIRFNSQFVDKNRKIFHHLAKNSCLSEPLVEKVENYINESVEVKKKFNIEEENGLVAHLPSGLRKQVHGERNFNLLRGLTFFGELLKSSIFNIADKMERRIYTPNEVIKKRDSLFEVCILEVGEIGYVAKKLQYCGNGLVSNTVKILKSGKPFLASLDFIRQIRGDFEVKSIGYSVVHKIGHEQLVSELRKHPKDHQYFCYLKDKSKHIIDEFETVGCRGCGGRHLFFLCPKFHFIPIRSHVVGRHLTKLKQLLNQRNKLGVRDSKPKKNSLSNLYDVSYNGRQFSESFRNFNQRSLKFITQKQRFLKSILGHLQSSIGTIEQSQNQLQNDKFIRVINEVIRISDNGIAFKFQQHHDEVWQLCIDKIHDYEVYFPNNNAINLKKTLPFKSHKKMSDQCKKIKTSVNDVSSLKGNKIQS